MIEDRSRIDSLIERMAKARLAGATAAPVPAIPSNKSPKAEVAKKAKPPGRGAPRKAPRKRSAGTFIDQTRNYQIQQLELALAIRHEPGHSHLRSPFLGNPGGWIEWVIASYGHLAEQGAQQGCCARAATQHSVILVRTY